MERDEIIQRANAFRQSIARGKLTREQVEKTVLQWVGFEGITAEQIQTLLQELDHGQ